MQCTFGVGEMHVLTSLTQVVIAVSTSGSVLSMEMKKPW